jgi:hypothetical protein
MDVLMGKTMVVLKARMRVALMDTNLELMMASSSVAWKAPMLAVR